MCWQRAGCRASWNFLFGIVVCVNGGCGRLNFLASGVVVRGVVQCQMCVIVECAAESVSVEFRDVNSLDMEGAHST
ncbi:hypothetical protein B0H16DRAFT_1566341 [Mycena metata]|uniref:Uncharacterized protein n=1 Tax=Mycena metata TaxID=1033252 RepID=A0AAD7N0Y3_9AGAR|nr:hypothetical protein B0H16DRAFT_1566341 [Mycena metata]